MAFSAGRLFPPTIKYLRSRASQNPGRDLPGSPGNKCHALKPFDRDMKGGSDSFFAMIRVRPYTMKSQDKGAIFDGAFGGRSL